MQLRNRGVYRFSDAAASLYRGLELVADRTLHGYALYTTEEWASPWSDPHLVADTHGRILRQGAWTGYTVEELVPTRASVDRTPGHWPVLPLARRHRHANDP